MAIPTFTRGHLEGSTWEPDSGINVTRTEGGRYRTRRMADDDIWSGNLVLSLTPAEMRNLQTVYDTDPDATHTGFTYDGDYNSPVATYSVTILNRPHGELEDGEYSVVLPLIGVKE